MSDEFVKSNNEGAIRLFYDRQIYQAAAGSMYPEWYDQSGHTNVLDFRNSEKLLYGRVDRYYVPIFLNRSEIPMVPLVESGLKQSRLMAASFVADAFQDLSMQFQKSAMMRKISGDESYLTTLAPEKAYEDPQNLYYIYSNKIIGVLQEYYAENNIEFENFNEFLVHLKQSLANTAPKFPITFPAYMKSRYCPITCTGLVVEIADISSTDDQAKFNEFISSKNWNFYINACRSYGFSVDLNNPWRIIADIGSSEMLKYARKDGFLSTSDILNTGYSPAHLAFYRGFKDFLLNLYNNLKADTYMKIEYCQSGRTISKVITTQTYSLEDIENMHPESFFIDLYCHIRFLEEENKFSSHEQMNIIRDCMELYKLKGIEEALRQFEKIINRTYNYAGSLTDKVRRGIVGE